MIASAFRKIAPTLTGLSFLLGIVWLIRGPLGVQQYTVMILLVAFSLGFLGRLFKTEIGSGAGRAFVSFLWGITAASVGLIIGIFVLGWIASLQSDVFPTVISSRVPYMVIAAIISGLGAYALQKSGLERRFSTLKAFVVPEGKGPMIEGTRLTVKKDTVAMPIQRGRRTIGCAILGEVAASFQTPMGTVSASLPGPITTVGIPFQGRALSKDEAVKLTTKTPAELMDESDSRMEHVDVGRIRIRDGCMGDRWKIGPLIFDWDDGSGELHRKSRWLAKGNGDSYVSTDGHRATAKWNGSSLSLGDGTMSLAVGSDSFSYSPTEVRTMSPHHSLQVTQDKIILDTRRFTLKVSGNNVVLRTETKTSTSESRAFANDLRVLLTETAKKQVRDVMEGTPIDLGEMFDTTEKVLAKHD